MKIRYNKNALRKYCVRSWKDSTHCENIEVINFNHSTVFNSVLCIKIKTHGKVEVALNHLLLPLKKKWKRFGNRT